MENSGQIYTSPSTLIQSTTSFLEDNISGNDTNPDPKDLYWRYDKGLTQLAAVVCYIFMVVGVPGNLITIIALARCKKVRNATAFFIINLAVCDLLFCCFNLPIAANLFWTRHWTHGESLCRLFPFFRYGLMAVSIFSVLAITLNRYFMIGHPRLYPRLYRTRNLGIMICLIWLGCFGAVFPTLFGLWGKFSIDKEFGCSIVKDENGRNPKTYLFMLAFILPCCSIIICYARIFFIVRKATRNLHPVKVSSVFDNIESESLAPPQTHRLHRTLSNRPSISVVQHRVKLSNKDKKLLWMILVIFGAFVICYLPITVGKAGNFFGEGSVWNIYGYLLIYVTTCINPLVYVLMSSDYRQAYTNLFCCRTEMSVTSNRTSSTTNKT